MQLFVFEKNGKRHARLTKTKNDVASIKQHGGHKATNEEAAELVSELQARVRDLQALQTETEKAFRSSLLDE